MKLFYKLLLPAILFPFFTFAQSNYKQGYIVNSKGDTIKGYIDLKEWESNPADINFKTSLDKSDIQDLTVNDINSFEIPMYVAYRRFTVSISLDETNIQRLGYQRDTTSKTGNVFLKVEQRGKNITLYSYNDNLKDRYYIYDSQNRSITELTYRQYYVNNDKNNVTTVSQNAYKQQLLLLAQKFNVYNSSLNSQIEDSNYDVLQLQEICRKINGTTKAEDEKNTVHKTFVRFYGGLAVDFNTIKLSGTTPLYGSASSYSSVTPRISAGFSFYPRPDVGRYLLRVEFAYASAEYKTKGSLYYYNQGEVSTFDVKQHNICIIPQFLYNIYNTDPFKLYVDLGIQLSISSYANNSVYNPVTQDTDNDFVGFNNRWLSVPAKLGIVLNKRINISFTYIPQTSISDNVAGHHQDFDSNYTLSTLQVGVNYIF